MSNRNFYYEPEVIVQKKGGLLGKIIALLLGIIIGIIAGIGGVAGGIYYVVCKMKIDKTFELVNSLTGTNIDYTKFINGEYGEKTVLNLVGDTASAIDKISSGTGTLNTLNEISPYVETLIKGNGEDDQSGLVYILSSYGIKVDGDEMMTKIISKPADVTESFPDKYLVDYVTDAAFSVAVGDLIYSLSGNPVEGIMRSLCYGVEDVDYTVDTTLEGNPIKPKEGGQSPLTINDFMENKLDGRIDALPLDSLLEIDLNDSIMCSLAYGSNHRYDIVDGKAEMKQLYYVLEQNEDGTTTLCNDMHDPFTSTVFQPFTSETFNGYLLQFENKDGEEVTQYLTPSAQNPAFLLAYSAPLASTPIYFEKTTVGSMDNANDLVNCITLKDAMNITADSEAFLISLAYGVEDVDYKIVTDENGKTIELLNDAEPRTIGDLRQKSGDLINEIYLSDVASVSLDDPDTLVMYMLYGKEDLHWQIRNGKVEMLQEQVAVYDGVVYGEYGDVVIGASLHLAGEQKIMTMRESGKQFVLTFKEEKAIKLRGDAVPKNATEDIYADSYFVWTLEGEAVKFDHAHLGDLKGEHPALFSNMTQRLTMSDVLGDDGLSDNKILKHLKDEKIADMPNAVANLTVGQVFEDDIYKTRTIVEGEGENAITVTYFVDENDRLLVYDEVEDAYFTKDTHQPSQRVLKGSWKYLLTEKTTDENGVVTETVRLDYKITGKSTSEGADGMSAMMDNMTNNIQTATLMTLVQDDIISLDDAQREKLENNDLIKNMTISQLIDYALNPVMP